MACIIYTSHASSNAFLLHFLFVFSSHLKQLSLFDAKVDITVELWGYNWDKLWSSRAIFIIYPSPLLALRTGSVHLHMIDWWINHGFLGFHGSWLFVEERWGLFLKVVTIFDPEEKSLLLKESFNDFNSSFTASFSWPWLWCILKLRAFRLLSSLKWNIMVNFFWILTWLFIWLCR